jgi:hypothetical protein
LPLGRWIEVAPDEDLAHGIDTLRGGAARLGADRNTAAVDDRFRPLLDGVIILTPVVLAWIPKTPVIQSQRHEIERGVTTTISPGTTSQSRVARSVIARAVPRT